ncbi:ABC transporter ATP-binding protein [uncultured Streptococcus sp.]|uniref:ATP-binding cassette domain-containing protein n=1 Tax=uncultured Streptococcus sp. TaxID=83427 RepID=UPI00265D9CD7|nr:ABC transporter ATP-binding protein [uncultured Streptococcus sp.]
MRTYILKYKYENLVHILLLALNAAILVSASVTLALMTNQLVSKQIQSFLVLLGLEVGLYVIYLVLNYIITVHQAKLIQKMSLVIRQSYLSKITHHSFSEFRKIDIGEHLSVLNNDIQLIESNGFTSIYTLCSTVFTTLFSIIALLSYDVRIVLLAILLTLCLTYLPKPFATKMQKSMERFSKANEELVSGISDQLYGYADVYYASRKQIFLRQVKSIVEDFISQKIIYTKRSTSTETLMSLFSVIAQMLILLLTGLLIIFGNIAVGTIASVGQISGNIFNSLSTINQLQVTIKSVEPILRKFEDYPTVSKSDLPIFQDINFENVRYSFGENAIIKGFTQTFKEGGKYAITGCSGSGKSTLLNLLLGNLKDYEGKILFGKLESKEIDENSIVSACAYVGSQTHIYNDTLRNNLTLWNDAITDTHIKEALERVNLLSFLSRIDEQVNDGSFSEGQKQRIGLIRAFLKGSSVVIFDEATANLDHDNATRIEYQLLSDPDITFITVTHHLIKENELYFDKIVRLGESDE